MEAELIAESNANSPSKEVSSQMFQAQESQAHLLNPKDYDSICNLLQLRKKEKKYPDRIKNIEMCMGNMSKIVNLHFFPNLKVLSLLHQGIAEIEVITTYHQVQGLSQLVQLEELYLNGNQIQSLKNIQANENLVILNLDENKINLIDYDHLSKLTRLKRLWLNSNLITSFSSILNSLPGLEELYLAGNQISAIQLTDTHRNLKCLNLSANKISSLRQIQILKKLTNLSNLFLSDAHFGDNPLCHLSNYQTYSIYHLIETLKILDGYQVSQEAKIFAFNTFVKKKMYYNMKIQSITRTKTMIKRILKCAETLLRAKSLIKFNLLNKYISKLRQSSQMSKLIQSENMSLEQREQMEELDSYILTLEDDDKNEVLYEFKDIDIEFQNVLLEFKDYFFDCVSRQELELETGGNVRFEEWNQSKQEASHKHSGGFQSIKSLTITNYFKPEPHYSPSIKAQQEKQIEVSKMVRIYNRHLRHQFEENMETYFSNSQNHTCEYLYLIQTEKDQILKIIEFGFSEDEELSINQNKVLILTNNPSIAQLCNVNYSCNSNEVLLCKCVYNNSYITCGNNDNGIPFSDIISFRNNAKNMNGKIKSAYYQISEHSQSKIFVIKNEKYIINCMPECLIELKEQSDPLQSEENQNSVEAIVESLNSAYSRFIKTVHPTGNKLAFLTMNNSFLQENHLFILQRLQFVLQSSNEKLFEQIGAGQSNRRDKIISGKDKLSSEKGNKTLNTSLVENFEKIQINKRIKSKEKRNIEEIIRKIGELDDSIQFNSLSLWKLSLQNPEFLIEKFKLLKWLDLSHNYLNETPFLTSSLEYLDLSFNNLPTFSPKIMSLSLLTHLKLNNNLIKTLKPIVSKYNDYNTTSPNIETLDLYMNPVCLKKNYKSSLHSLFPSLKTLDAQYFILPLKPQTLSVFEINDEEFRTIIEVKKQPIITVEFSQYCNTLQILVLSNCNLRSLGFLAKQETQANISSNDLVLNNDQVETPHSNILGSLQQLVLDRNQFREIPNLRSLEKLTLLDVQSNKIQELKGVEFNRKLRSINANNNKIQILSSFNLQNSKLVELYIANNFISDMSEVLDNKVFHKLLILDIFGNPLYSQENKKAQIKLNQYSSPNRPIDKLEGKIQLKEQVRERILVALKKLKVLDGETIDQEAKKQVKDNLTGKFTLDIFYSQLKDISTQQMSELDLSNNGIKEIKFTFDEIMFPKLKLLILSNNKINSIQFVRSLPKLKVLILSNNKLKALSCSDNNNGKGGVYSLNELEYLDVSYNDISDMSALMQTPNLQELKILRLSNNKVSKISFLQQLTKLYELDISSNQVKHLDKNSFNSPNIISCFKAEDNAIKSLSNIENLSCLSKLYLSGNKISELAEVDRCINMRLLEELTLFSTPLSRRNLYRHNIVKKLSKLKFLDHIEVTSEERSRLLMTERAQGMQPLLSIPLVQNDKKIIQSIDCFPLQQYQATERNQLTQQYQLNSAKLHPYSQNSIYSQQQQNPSYQNSTYNSGQLQINAQKYPYPMTEDKSKGVSKQSSQTHMSKQKLDEYLTLKRMKQQSQNQSESVLPHQQRNQQTFQIEYIKITEVSQPMSNSKQKVSQQPKRDASRILDQEESKFQNEHIIHPSQEYTESVNLLLKESEDDSGKFKNRGKGSARGLNGDFESIIHQQKGGELPNIQFQQQTQSKQYKQNVFMNQQYQQSQISKHQSRNQQQPNLMVTPSDFYNFVQQSKHSSSLVKKSQSQQQQLPEITAQSSMSSMSNANQISETNFSSQAMSNPTLQAILKQSSIKVAQVYNVFPSSHTRNKEYEQGRAKRGAPQVTSLNMAAFGSSIMKTDRSNSIEMQK